MKTTDLYHNKFDCCGCELCSHSCPKGIIRMIPDEAGFLYPQIEDDTSCIDCKKCLSVCPIKRPGRNSNIVVRSFSFSLKNDEDLKKSASGGLVTEISRRFVRSGGVVYGVEYSEDCLSVRFGRATSENEIERFRGSKYVQATKNGVFHNVKTDLTRGLKVLFIGLPCEISAIYHAVGDKENLYTLSLICHGPTSQRVHQDYCKSIMTNPNDSIKSISVRYKLTGWKPYYIHCEFERGRVSNEQFNQSDYNTAFLYMKRPSCRTCHYKADEKDFGLLADLIAGDFHGVKTESPQYNKWGVSQGSVLSEKGEYLVSLLSKDYELPEIPYETIRTTNRGMYVAIPQRGNYKKFVDDYNTKSLHEASHSMMVRMNNFFTNIGFMFNRIKRIPSKVIGLIQR